MDDAVPRAGLGLTLDCRDVPAQARFWALALGYEPAPPPTGWASWEQWLRDHDVPEEEWDDGAVLHDPAGHGPSLSLLAVPEPKTAKNRLHLDLQVSGGRAAPAAQRQARIEAVVTRLVAAGGWVLQRVGDPLDHVVLADPEGNELCVV